MSALHRIALPVAVVLLWGSYARHLDLLMPIICISCFVIAAVLGSFDYKKEG